MRVLRFCNLCDVDFVAAQRTARFCPDCRLNRKWMTWNRFSWESAAVVPWTRSEACLRCGKDVPEGRGSYCSNECRHAAWDYHKNHRRRSAYAETDLTPEIEQDLRRRTRICVECGCHMVKRPGTPRSKELDHILSLHVGGTHTLANVRVICRKCNLSRPKDARDIPIQLALVAS